MENNFFVVKRIFRVKNVKTTAQMLLLLQNDVHLQTIEPINATIFGLENSGHNNELVV